MVTGRQELEPETMELEVSPCVSRKERLASAPCPPHCSWRRREVVTGRKEVAPEGVDPKLEVAAVERKKSGN